MSDEPSHCSNKHEKIISTLYGLAPHYNILHLYNLSLDMSTKPNLGFCFLPRVGNGADGGADGR